MFYSFNHIGFNTLGESVIRKVKNDNCIFKKNKHLFSIRIRESAAIGVCLTKKNNNKDV